MPVPTTDDWRSITEGFRESYGRTSDGGVLANSIFGQALQDGTLGIPEDALLPGADHLGLQPFVFPLRRERPKRTS
ncbi:unnamed protein product [Boreogadus saida]